MLCHDVCISLKVNYFLGSILDPIYIGWQMIVVLSLGFCVFLFFFFARVAVGENVSVCCSCSWTLMAINSCRYLLWGMEILGYIWQSACVHLVSKFLLPKEVGPRTCRTAIPKVLTSEIVIQILSISNDILNYYCIFISVYRKWHWRWFGWCEGNSWTYHRVRQ